MASAGAPSAFAVMLNRSDLIQEGPPSIERPCAGEGVLPPLAKEMYAKPMKTNTVSQSVIRPGDSTGAPSLRFGGHGLIETASHFGVSAGLVIV